MVIFNICRSTVLFLTVVTFTLMLVVACSSGEDATPAFVVQIVKPQSSTYNTLSTTSTKSDNITFTGYASDPNDGQLSGDALVWSYTNVKTGVQTTLGTGTGSGSDPKIESDFAAGEYTVQLTATNSTGTSKTTTKNLFINRMPISIVIKQPAPGATLIYSEKDPIHLVGEVYDPEDGYLSGSALKWSSRSITPEGLAPFAVGADAMFPFPTGLHTLWLLATDSAGAPIGSSIRFTVVDGDNNLAPEVSITMPVDKTEFTYGDSISFMGTATDDKDGELSGNALVWTSSIDGLLGNDNTITCEIANSPSSCNKILSLGQHTITLSATDSGFKTGVASVKILVNPNPDNPDIDTPPTNDTVKADFIDFDPAHLQIRGLLLPDKLTLTLAAHDDKGLTGYYISIVDDGKIPTAPTPNQSGWININGLTSYSNTLIYSLNQNYALGSDITLFVWFKDTIGQLSAYASDSIKYIDVALPINNNATIPSYSDFINAGEINTYSKNVNLSLNAEDLWGIAGYYVAENPNATQPAPPLAIDPGWTNVAATKNFNQIEQYTLTGNYPANSNTVTLKVWFKDAAGNVSEAAAEDTIEYVPFITNYDFDTINALWTFTGDWQIGTPSNVGPGNCIASLGQCAGTVMNGNYTQASSLESEVITLPAIWPTETIQLTVAHWYSFDFSTGNNGNGQGGGMMGGGGGATPAFTDFGYFEIAQQNTNGVFGNWTTLKSFSGASTNWFILSQDLSSYAGQTIKVRFRLAPDPISLLNPPTQPGWYVDNFKINVQ